MLKNMETLNRLPFAARNAVFERLSQIAEVRSLTHEEQVQYENSLRNYRDTYAVMEGRYLDGIEQGIEQGRAKERIANAQKMKAMGLDTATIMQITGLAADDIDSL